jgi:hypothetical protein
MRQRGHAVALHRVEQADVRLAPAHLQYNSTQLQQRSLIASLQFSQFDRGFSKVSIESLKCNGGVRLVWNLTKLVSTFALSFTNASNSHKALPAHHVAHAEALRAHQVLRDGVVPALGPHPRQVHLCARVGWPVKRRTVEQLAGCPLSDMPS